MKFPILFCVILEVLSGVETSSAQVHQELDAHSASHSYGANEQPSREVNDIADANPTSEVRAAEPSPGFSLPAESARDLTYSFGYDSWRGVQDGGWANNGLHTSLNFGSRLGTFSERTGIGAQIGATFGSYDWSGTDYRFKNQDKAETQGFLTTGFFRRATSESRWSGAFVNDWMFNDTFGVLAENPTLSQWRWQIGYALNEWNEFGIWGTGSGQSDSRMVAPFGNVVWQSHNQYSLYMHHKWGVGGADTTISVGVPEHGRLAEVPVGSRNIGSFVVGMATNAPLSDYVGLYSLVTYMHPSIGAGAFASNDEAWQIMTGVSFSFGGRARSETVRGNRWAPLTPVANNGYFLVDTNKWY